MTEHPTSPFAVAHSSNAPALLQFLEHQTEVLGAVDRQHVWEALVGMKGLKVVDFGCGEGSYLSSLIQGAPTDLFAEVLGLDVNPDWLQIARQRSFPMAAAFRLESELSARLLQDFNTGRLGCMATNLVIAQKA